MSYLVLARKWRPQTFEEVRGQDHIVRALRNAIASCRIAHAYLFTGIRGVGKTSAARVLAKALNCTAGPTPTPCNACDACRQITDGKSPDVLEIDGASNTGVEDVRRLREAVRYPPVGGPYRIYIIDEVHMLSTAAFNALLKTLEEPPPHVVFIFATTDPHKIPVTILSRCQQFDFKRLAPRELVALLGDVARAEGIEIDDKSLTALAREAEGSVRDGQSLLDQVISYAGQRVAYEDVRDVLGVVDRDLLLAVAGAVVRRDPRQVVERLAEAERFGYDVRRFALDLLDVFRDLAVLKAVDGGEDLVELAPDEVAEAQEFTAGVGWEDVHARFDMLGRGLEFMRSAPRPGALLEMTLLKMAQLPALLSLAETVKLARGAGSGAGGGRQVDVAPAPERSASRRAAAEERRPPAAPDEPPIPPPPAASRRPAEPDPAAGNGSASAEPGDRPAATPPDPAAEVPPGGLWERLLQEAASVNRPFWSVLREHAALLAWDEAAGTARVGYDDPKHEFFIRSKQEVLEGLLRRLTGTAARVELRCTGAQPQAPGEARDSDRARSIKREVLEHPLVREALEIFEGDVEEVRVLKP